MILNGITKIQKLLPSVNLRLDSTRLDDFMLRAQQWVTDEIIGTDIEEVLEVDTKGNATDDHATLRLLVQRVIATKAYLTVGDEMNLQLGEAGMVVQNNEAMSAASSQRRDNLMRSLEERLDYDCDALTDYLIGASTDGAAYDYWRGTEQYAYLTVAFMPTLKALRRHLPSTAAFSGHWPDYHNTRLETSMAMMDTAASYVSMAEITRLRELYRDGDLNAVQREAIEQLRTVAACHLVGDGKKAVAAAIHARNIMLGSLADFTAFAESDCVNLTGVDFNAGHIVDTL